MDKEIIYFLVSESRVLSYSSSPDSEQIIEAAKNAIKLGDKLLKIIEVSFEIDLPKIEENNDTSIEFKPEEDITSDEEISDAFNKNKAKEQIEVWDSMPPGIYRISKRVFGSISKTVSIEYCPDVDKASWKAVEKKGWSKTGWKRKR